MKFVKLFERYKNHNNIVKLASLIINAIANRTISYDKWNKGDKEIYDNSPNNLMDNILPIILSNIDVKGKGFDKEFIKFIKDKNIWFRISTHIASDKTNKRGEYIFDNNTDKKQLQINLYYNYNDVVDYYNSLNEDISNMNYHNLVKFLNIRKNTLEHELQHAYDDRRSDGKAFKNIVRLPNRESDDYIEKHKEYSNTEHEISAFFTNTATKILDYSYKNDRDLFSSYNLSNWKDCIEAFKREFPNWSNVTPETKKKLISRFYILWAKQFKKKIKNIDITDKVKILQETLRSKYNTNDILLWYYHDNNYIKISEMYANSTEDEESILKEIIKLADTYRKTVGISVYKKHTSIYVMKTKKLLRVLGFNKNYGTSKSDYRFREEWIRPSKRKI